MLARVAKWQTQQTQNLPGCKPRVGSTPTSGTTKPRLIIGDPVGSTPTSGTTKPRLIIGDPVGSTPTSGTRNGERASRPQRARVPRGRFNVVGRDARRLRPGRPLSFS